MSVIGIALLLLMSQTADLQTTPEQERQIQSDLDDIVVSLRFDNDPASINRIEKLKERGTRNDSWILVARSSDGEMTYLRVKDIKAVRGSGIVWFKRIIETSSSKGGRSVTIKMAKVMYNCSNETETIMAASNQTNNLPKTSVEIPSYQQQAQSIEPETVGEALMKAACVGK